MKWIMLSISTVQIICSAPNFNAPLTRPTTLRNLEINPTETEYHRQIESGKYRSYILPRACISTADSSKICQQQSSTLNITSNPQLNHLHLTPVGGAEYRYTEENVEAFQGGVVSHGFSGPLSFYLDARMFTELHEDFLHPSYDRELVERQSKEASGSFEFSSYSRYRANLSLNFDWARLTAARDALHWGPGLFQNLVFHQDAVPFNYLSFESRIGPFAVSSIYGQLAIDGGEGIRISSDSRSIYAHRYEWNITSNLLVGISEQLVLYNTEEAFSFIPVVPLFIAKGTGEERKNNGNIAIDLSAKFWNRLHTYTEFLIDDMIAPSALFDDFWGNRWAWMAGSHYIHSFKNLNFGSVLEYSKIEPWVYAHYDPNTAQSGNQNYPLGNQNGPNSQNLIQKLYLKNSGHWYLSLQFSLLWKGTDPGSHLNDPITDETQNNPKHFIRGVGQPEFVFKPYFRWKLWSRMFVEGEAELGENWNSLLRAQFWY